MASNILTVCDALVTAIDAAWTTKTADSGSVSREYIAPLSTSELSSLTGRKVYVIPGDYVNNPATRKEDQWEYRIGVLVVERYASAGLPSNSWMDTRVDFVENIVANACDYSHSLLSVSNREVWTESLETQTYNLDLLNESNLFWSETSLVLREIIAV